MCIEESPLALKTQGLKGYKAIVVAGGEPGTWDQGPAPDGWDQTPKLCGPVLLLCLLIHFPFSILYKEE